MDWTLLNNNNFDCRGQTKHNLIALAFLSSICVPLFYVQCILGAFRCLPPSFVCVNILVRKRFPLYSSSLQHLAATVFFFPFNV